MQKNVIYTWWSTVFNAPQRKGHFLTSHVWPATHKHLNLLSAWQLGHWRHVRLVQSFVCRCRTRQSQVFSTCSKHLEISSTFDSLFISESLIMGHLLKHQNWTLKVGSFCHFLRANRIALVHILEDFIPQPLLLIDITFPSRHLKPQGPNQTEK